MSNPEYTVAHFIDTPIPGGTRVDAWPLHMTLISPFTLNGSSQEAVALEAIKRAGQETGPLQLLNGGIIAPGAVPLVPSERDFFGESNEVEVIRIDDPSDQLVTLHKNVLVALGRLGCGFIGLNPLWSGDNYHPHATTKSGVTLNHPFFMTTLSLNKKSGKKKTVVGTVDLYNQRLV